MSEKVKYIVHVYGHVTKFHLGLLLLAKKSIDLASRQFKFCLEKVSDNVPAQLGQAIVYFFNGNYRSALGSFQGLLKACPQFNELRLAIGFCFHNIGQVEMATKAFTRVLEIDPENESALIALGFIQLGRQDDPKSLQNGLIRMKEAYEKNRTSSLPAIHLANHFFFKKDMSKARALAETALIYAGNDQARAEAHFIIAKIAHISGNFIEAFVNYQASAKFSPSFLPALFGLGQCFLARNDFDNAVMIFEKVLENDSECKEAVRLLSMLYVAQLSKADPSARSGLLSKAQQLLPKALNAFPDDIILLQSAASVSESTDASKAVEHYEKLMKLNPTTSENFAVLNNLTVLRQSLGTIEGGLAALEKAKDNLAKDNSTQSSQLESFIQFNTARLLEDEGKHDDAEAIYRSLLVSTQASALSYLRLGIINFNRGQLAEAADYFKDVMGSDPLNRDAWNCLAATQFAQKAFTPARKAFERVLQDIDKHDAYALVSLGNIYFELARSDKARKHVSHFIQLYTKL